MDELFPRPLPKPIVFGASALHVLSLAARGLSSSEIADAASLSKRTVDFHLGQIYRRLNVTNRMQAVRVAQRLGLIPGER